MKPSIVSSLAIIIITAASVTIGIPGRAYAAEDDKSPGKASDSVKEPPAKAPASRATTGSVTPGHAPGKESDAVHEAKNAARFAGRITQINRAEKTIVIEDESRRKQTLHIGAESKLMKGKDKAAWETLKEGAHVRGTVSGSGDQAHVVTLDINE